MSVLAKALRARKVEKMSNYDPRAAFYVRKNKTQKSGDKKCKESANKNVGGNDSNYRDES